MRKKRDKTAEEFAAQLKSDPTYQAKLARQAETTARIQAAEATLMKALASKGYRASSLGELVRGHTPLSHDLADALVESLGQVSEPGLQEGVLRALGAARARFNVGPLIELFEQTDSTTLRWAIANTLAETRPAERGDWLIRALKDRRYGKAREMLALAAARANPPEIVNPILVRLLDELPGHVALALAETGGLGELDALRRAYANATGWEREQIGRSVNTIERREAERR